MSKLEYVTRNRMSKFYKILRTLRYKARTVYEISRKSGVSMPMLEIYLLDMRRRSLISYVKATHDKLHYYTLISGFVFMECCRNEGIE